MITFVFLECNSSGDWPLVQEHENYSHCIHKQILFLIDKELVIPLEHDFFGCKYYQTYPLELESEETEIWPLMLTRKRIMNLVRWISHGPEAFSLQWVWERSPFKQIPPESKCPAQEKTKNIHVLWEASRQVLLIVWLLLNVRESWTETMRRNSKKRGQKVIK